MKLRHSAEEEEEQFCQMCLQRNVQGIEHLHQMAVVRSSLHALAKAEISEWILLFVEKHKNVFSAQICVELSLERGLLRISSS